MPNEPLNPDESPDPDADAELQKLADLIGGMPAGDFQAMLDCPLNAFGSQDRSQSMILNQIHVEMERQGLSDYDLYMRVERALYHQPGVTAEDLESFDFETCVKWLAEGVPTNDDIWISGFQLALGIRLTDL